MHNSDNKDIQNYVSFLNATDIICVICAKKFRTEKKLKDSWFEISYEKKESAMGIPVNIVVDHFWPNKPIRVYNKST